MSVRSLLLLGAVLATSACTRESARADVPADITGVYTFAGADTTATIPWAARAELMLHADSTFYFDLRLRVKDEDQRESHAGRYRVEGDRLVLVDADSARGDHPGIGFRIRSDSLVMDANLAMMAALRLIGVPRPVLVRGR